MSLVSFILLLIPIFFDFIAFLKELSLFLLHKFTEQLKTRVILLCYIEDSYYGSTSLILLRILRVLLNKSSMSILLKIYERPNFHPLSSRASSG